MKPIFVECYSVESKAILIDKGFTFIPEQSNCDKFIFLNDGQFDFSNSGIEVKMHSDANV